MYLDWLNCDVDSVSELLWYLHESPPPQSSGVNTTVCRTDIFVNSQQGVGVSSAENSAESGRSLHRSCRPPPKVTIMKRTRDSSPASLFALIIGIDNYKDSDVPNLCGAVADAKKFREFLISKVGLTEDRVVFLHDEEATREKMLDNIKYLSQNPAISTQDPILIYYAGHGGEAPSPFPKPNNENDMIQMLIPHDFVSEGSKDKQGQGIFDLTLCKLLGDIAKNKSDNITVIFDSCHSASGTRTNQLDETFAFRSFKLPPDYTIPANVFELAECSSSILSADEKTGLNCHDLLRSTYIPSPYKTAGLSSHVLLAACQRGEKATERKGCGVFTSALLDLLEREGIDQLTYKDVIMRLPDLPGQHPQCEGVSKLQDRVLFNSKVASSSRLLYRIRAMSSEIGSDERGMYILQAGEAHGVTKEAKFMVYSDEKLSYPIGRIVACDTAPFTTQCAVIGDKQFSLSTPAYAVQTHVGEGQDLHLFIELNIAFQGLFERLAKEMHRTDTHNRSFRLFDSDKDCEELDLAIRTRGPFVELHVMNKRCREYGLTRMPFDDIRVNESDYLLSILRSAADFFWNLRHSNKSASLTQQITFECFKLVPNGKYTEDFDEILDQKGENLNQGGTIFINVDDEAIYGYKITNNSNFPLYAALLCFDVSDLTIVEYYLPATAANGKVDFSLPAKGSLTIGFGDSGRPPVKYELKENQSVDVSFLKLYLSTEFVDYSGIIQRSPFQKVRSSAKVLESLPSQKRLWDTLTIQIIQQKGIASGQGSGSGAA